MNQLLDRRAFLGSLGAAATLLCRSSKSLGGRVSKPTAGTEFKLSFATNAFREIPDDLKVTRAISFDLHTTRSKYLGKNAKGDDHGQSGMDRLVRLETNMGVSAIGRCWRDREAVAKLIGTNPFADGFLEKRRIESCLGRRTMVLWDLAGRILGKPVYQLLGATENRGVPVYDGSFYFSDLIPKYANNWKDRFARELDLSRSAGHKALKAKIGRGLRWMPQAEGDQRDVEVVNELRRLAGEDFFLAVDANNAYDLERAKQFALRTAEAKLAFIEEPFPEDVKACQSLKAFFKETQIETLLADGEGTEDESELAPLVSHRAIDVLQGDMYTLGIEGILAESKMCEGSAIKIAPHNFSSLMSLFMQAHFALAIPNFLRAEVDPLSTTVLGYDG